MKRETARHRIIQSERHYIRVVHEHDCARSSGWREWFRLPEYTRCRRVCMYTRLRKNSDDHLFQRLQKVESRAQIRLYARRLEIVSNL